MFSLGKVPLQVRGRSGFNKDHRFCATPAVGNLVPVLSDPVIPGTRVSIKGALKAQLFPLATDAFANLDYRLEGFFVPYRVLYGGFEFAVTGKYIDSGQSTDEPSPQMIGTRYKAAMPRLVVHYNDQSERTKMGAGSLSDYLGYKTGKTPSPAGSANTRYFNLMPFLAYHMIYDQFYRNPIVQKSVFAPANAYESRDLSTLPYRSIARFPTACSARCPSTVPTCRPSAPRGRR